MPVSEDRQMHARTHLQMQALVFDAHTFEAGALSPKLFLASPFKLAL